MADSILYHIFSSSFLQFAVILIIVNKTLSHTSRELFQYEYIAEDPVPDFVLCRQCGGDVADSHYIINQLSPEALIRSNQSLFGRPEIEVQLLLNPLGIQFHIFTTESAKCIGVGENWQDQYSWFPGYAWKLCFCSQCGTHLGWMFEPLRTATDDRSLPSNEGFYALILDSVIKIPLTDEQKAFIAESDEEFKDRYTDKDEEFMKLKSVEPKHPPIMDPWYNKPPRNFDWSRQNQGHDHGGGGGGGGGRRNQGFKRRHDRSDRHSDHHHHNYYKRNYPN